MMTDHDLVYYIGLLSELRKLPKEAEWVEFKGSNANPQEIGEYISGLSNAAALNNKVNAYLVWGVEDETHDVVGTSFRPTETKKGNEEIENWLSRQLSPRIHFRFIEFDVDDKHISIIEIPRA